MQARIQDQLDPCHSQTKFRPYSKTYSRPGLETPDTVDEIIVAHLEPQENLKVEEKADENPETNAGQGSMDSSTQTSLVLGL